MNRLLKYGLLPFSCMIIFLGWKVWEDKRWGEYSAKVGIEEASLSDLQQAAIKTSGALGLEQLSPQALDNAPEMDVGSNPYSSLPYHLGPATLENVKLRYFESIEAARSGDVEAMRVIAQVLYNCQRAWDFSDPNAAENFYEQALITLEEYDWVKIQIAECDPIAEDVITEFPNRRRLDIAFDVKREWLIRASEGGSKLARLELLADLPGKQAEEIATLLDELVALNHPEAFFRAARFEATRSRDDAIYVRKRWEYLGCLHLDTCNADLYKSNLKANYASAEYYAVVDFAENFESLEKSGISFKTIHDEQKLSQYTSMEIAAFKAWMKENTNVDEIGFDIFKTKPKPAPKSEPESI